MLLHIQDSKKINCPQSFCYKAVCPASDRKTDGQTEWCILCPNATQLLLCNWNHSTNYRGGAQIFFLHFFLLLSTLVRYYYFNCFFGNYQIDNYVIVLVVPFYPNYICTDRQENFLGGWSLHFFLCIAYLLFISFSFFCLYLCPYISIGHT